MKFKIVHESRGRIRVQVIQNRMTLEQADLLEAYLCTWPAAQQVTVYTEPVEATIEITQIVPDAPAAAGYTFFAAEV